MTRTQNKLAALLGMGLLCNGAFMLTAPQKWFETVPTVSLTGPLNAHFVRDVGCAYLLSGLAYVLAAIRGRLESRQVFWATGFLVLHAGVHLYEVAMNLCGWRAWLMSSPGVTLPALVAMWISWRRSEMPSTLTPQGA